MISDYFNGKMVKSGNTEEAVVRGATFYGAELVEENQNE